MHCDWLETLATFGAIGMGLLVAALFVLARRWHSPGRVVAPGGFVALAWLGLASCLLHAVMDFPFQVYSVIHLFIIVSAIVSTLSRSMDHRLTE